MRQSTQRKLFNDDDYTYLWDRTFDDGATVIAVQVGEVSALIVEFGDEKNGFEVFTKVPGNSVARARAALGLDDPAVTAASNLNSAQLAEAAKNTTDGQ